MSCSNNSIIWIIIVLLFCGCNGNNNGIGKFFGCGNDCNWIIILVILFVAVATTTLVFASLSANEILKKGDCKKQSSFCCNLFCINDK